MEKSCPVSEMFSTPPSLSSSDSVSAQVTSRAWPVGLAAGVWVVSAVTCFLPGSVTVSSIGYGAGVAATVVAMFAALDQRQRELNANYVRQGVNVSVLARGIRSLALGTSAVNIIWLASKVAE